MTAPTLGLVATGVHLHNRDTGADYAAHSDCWTAMAAALGELADPFTGVIVVIGPLFAPSAEWKCAAVECIHAECDHAEGVCSEGWH